MNKIIAKLNMKNIQELYNIQSITESGQINLKDKKIIIYRIDPANIIACDNETKHKIYQAYLTCIRGLPDAFQIVISKDNIDFTNQIIECKKRMQLIENEKLKIAIQKYVEYLNELSMINKLYKTSHYLIVENMNNNEVSEIINIFSNLEEFGVKISQVKSKEQVENILKRYVFKE